MPKTREIRDNARVSEFTAEVLGIPSGRVVN
jgi:hypothetical protein